jgi:hypothetical protein
MRRQRYFQSNHAYALTFRAKSGLPFPCWDTVKVLLESAIARAQRDNKITLCHYLWMGNHAHLIAVFHDANQAKKFYMEVKKKVTDYIKRLLEVKHLELWEKKESVIYLASIADAMEQISYLYLNPSSAGLERSIERYPGLNSFNLFLALKDEKTDSALTKEVPWIRQPSITALPPNRRLSRSEDKEYAENLKNTNKRKYPLTLKPNAWMKCFSVKDSKDVCEINSEILNEIRRIEAINVLENSHFKGASGLRNEQLMKAHTPKKKERRIFVIAKSKEQRTGYIKFIQKLFAECARLYQLQCRGYTVSWPPGVFPPAAPPLVNAL